MSEFSSNSMMLGGARLILPAGPVEEHAIVVEHGLIAGIIAHNERPGAAQVIDLAGCTLFPGFIDVHIHGAAGIDTMQANPSELTRVSQFLASQGVTGWLPTLVPAPPEDYRRALDAIGAEIQAQSLAPVPAARILGVHYEGPFVNTAQCGALRTQFFRAFSAPRELDELPTLADDCGEPARHMMTLAPEIEGGIELVTDLHRRGWIVSLGHTRADFMTLDRAREAGARHMTHFMNAMAPLHQRAPGPVAFGLARDDVTCDLVADGIHLAPEMLRLLVKLKGSGRLTLISDAVAAAGMGDGEYEIWGETISVKNGRTSNSRGAIAGSVITMLAAVKLMLSLGFSEGEVASMAATNPARLLGINGDCGAIEEGKRADLVALDARGTVVLAVVGGRVAFRSPQF
jgi:N-acetylglucosamine-6-phosphate deacetylase